MNIDGENVMFIRSFLPMIFGVVFGAISFHSSTPAYLMLLAPYGILLGALWRRSSGPFIACVATSIVSALSVPIASAFC